MIQKAIETTVDTDETGLVAKTDGTVLVAKTQTKRTGICVACAIDDMFSSFNTAPKATWLKR